MIPSSPQTILIVDDNPTNLEVLFDTLTGAGFEVAVASDGESALEQVAYQKPALILLDIMMPGISGFETCRCLKENPDTQGIPVIFTTALSDPENKIRGLALGAVDYITKPFYQEEVLARIRVHFKLCNLTVSLEQQNTILRSEVEQRQKAETALRELNQELEMRIDERTSELSATLYQLQQAQVHLVQTEKMSSLGQLVAGVAHEINNPVNFIIGNLKPASGYIQDLLKLLELYQSDCPNASTEIQEFSEQIDLPFLKTDLLKIFSSMQIGAERICQIVLSLRNFSRLDEAEIKLVDLHEGINSTLLILQHRLKLKGGYPPIQIVKDYSNLPLIECYPGPMNQVFMNLLSNALDAIEEKDKERNFEQIKVCPSRICIRTEKFQNDSVLVSISDNGVGISEEKLSKVFDPFFTTKPIGKGTGLGLSISHQIVVKKHAGKIECFSAPEGGTEFQIQIPLRQFQVLTN
jgi:signal transduction histidine kinase